MSTIIGCLLYFVFGAALSVPYCLLAGWGEEGFAVMPLVTPFLLFVWLLAAVFARVIDYPPRRIYWKNAFRRSHREFSRVPLIIFWIWTVYSTLPIIMHWTARLIGRFSNGPVAAFIEAHRFESLYVVFMGVLFLFLLLVTLGGLSAAIAGIRDSRKAAPPKNS